MSKTALITGVTGQDGAYLAKLLVDKGYKVYGAYRRSASLNLWRLAELGVDREIEMVAMELLEYGSIRRTIDKVAPNEIYNLAAQSFVAMSFEQPLYTTEVDGMGALRILEAIREYGKDVRFYQASTSEMFGKVRESPQSELTPFYPRSPYGVAKLMAHWMTVNYRESFNLHASSGILFNHESPLRGMEFVTRKITSTLASIVHGHAKVLELGNMDAKRDWGFAGDYVEGMWMMVQQDKGNDYVLCTGVTNTVRSFVEHAAAEVGLNINWEGEGEKEVGKDASGNIVVRVNPEYYRPAEVELLIGNNAKAQKQIGWKPRTSFETLVSMMSKADFDRAAHGRIVQ